MRRGTDIGLLILRAGVLALAASAAAVFGTPANKAALEHHYDRFLSSRLARCSTCHLPSDQKDPQSLKEFPHNPFGARLKEVRAEMAAESKDFMSRLKQIAGEDADGDGIANEKEILLGRNPGDGDDKPSQAAGERWAEKAEEFRAFLAAYRWKPFEAVSRPKVPVVKNTEWTRNPIDAFIAAEQEKRGLKPQREASKEVLLKRVYLDVVGLLPTIGEQEAFLSDRSLLSYEHLVDRLLDDPRYGERWGRHWMDIWRYSDWGGWSGGNQVRDSQPHIWRWRDWIVEALNADKGYDRMIVEMLAADELTPDDSEALRATGYLVRNYKMLSREQWLEDTIKHTGQAFLGLTIGCAKCHDHMYDPISQAEYYHVRAVFEPHQVRTDRVPGELDRAKNGLVRVYDTDTNAITHFLLRGDERRPDTNRVMTPGVLHALGGKFEPAAVALPNFAAYPDKREFVISDLVSASEAEVRKAKAELAKETEAAKKSELRLKSEIAELKHDALLAVLEAERLEDAGRKESDDWKKSAGKALTLQRKTALAEAELKLEEAFAAQKKFAGKVTETAQALAEVTAEEDTEKVDAAKLKERGKAAEKAKSELEEAEKKVAAAREKVSEARKLAESDGGTDYKARSTEAYPEKSTGRRLAFAKWIANEGNPLTARVAANHIWLRHFGQGIVATPADFGRNGRAPTHPQLLDWLAAELMSQGWRMKELHRLILKSSTYRLASKTDAQNSGIDPDNHYLWRASARRMEAELVRDNLLFAADDLEGTTGGPDIDHNLGLVSGRRSIYLRIGPEKEVEFLKIFDGPTVTECYVRRPSVNPQQALALHNSELTLREARRFAGKVWKEEPKVDAFIRSSFRRLIVREPTAAELGLCREYLAEQGKQRSPERARENLALVLMNHNDFVSIR